MASAVHASPDTRSSKASAAAPSSWWSPCASAAGRAPPACSRWRDMAVRELFELKGRVALITGGSRGLGLQIAQGLGEMGARIAISARKQNELDEAVAHLKKLKIDATAYVCDMGKRDAIVPVADEVLKKFGKVEILVNNAGAT